MRWLYPMRSSEPPAVSTTPAAARRIFALDRHAASGRKSHCKECDRRKSKAYYAQHRDELYAKREAVREAARQAELKRLEKEHRKRVAANEKLHEAQVRRQKEFLRSIGVPDLSPEEIIASSRGENDVA